MLTEQQKETRRKGLGGSDIAAICGLNPYKTPLQVYLEKLNLSEDTFVTNEKIDWGNRLEAIVAATYAETKGVTLQEMPTQFHPTLPFLLANIDRFIVDSSAVLEVKTTSERNAQQWGKKGSDRIPLPYLLQVAHYALVLDAPYVDIAVLIGGQEMRIYTYQRNAELESKIIRKATRFWEGHILKQVPPEPTTAHDTTLSWKDKTPLKDILVADAALLAIAQDYTSRAATLSALTKECDALKEQLQLALADHALLTDAHDNPLITYQTTERTGLDSKKLKGLNPELYAECQKTTSYRSLRVSS